jgi:bacillithiol synthase
VNDHLAGRAPAAGFFAGHPADAAAFRRKLEEVRGRFDTGARRAAAAALRPTSPGAAARLRRFVEEGGAMVTTGQQAGLFSGPLYTIHKIVTAIRLAERLERTLGVVVLPVFWVASEDHDFEEASETFAVDAAGILHRFAVAPTDPRPLAMVEKRLGRDVSELCDSLRKLVDGQGVASDHLIPFLAPYVEGATVAGAFGEMVARLFSGFDLLVTDAADPALKSASTSVLQQALTDADAHGRALADRTAALEAAGYAGQVKLVDPGANLFLHGAEGRERLERVPGGWRAPLSRERFTAEAAAAAVAAAPGRFSPNVLLRPVVESAVFPTLAYVGGPAELAYFAQCGALFDAYGIRPPVAFPRLSATIVPEEVDAARAGLPLEDDEFLLPEHEVWTRLARRTLPEEVRAGLERVRRELVESFGTLIAAAEGIDPNLRPALGARRDRALLEAADAERKVLSHHKKRAPDLLARLRLVRNHLAPRGVPQERVLNVLPFLARDPRLLERLAGAAGAWVDSVTSPGSAPADDPAR